MNEVLSFYNSLKIHTNLWPNELAFLRGRICAASGTGHIAVFSLANKLTNLAPSKKKQVNNSGALSRQPIAWLAQQKIKIVCTNQQANLCGSCQSIFSLLHSATWPCHLS